MGISKQHFLAETIQFMMWMKKTPADVLWVGSSNGKYAITWEEFEKIADFTYDSGYGTQHIANDLVVVFKDGWMEREEYDGSEWWTYKRMPRKSSETKKFKTVFGRCGYLDIKMIEKERLNEEKNRIG